MTTTTTCPACGDNLTWRDYGDGDGMWRHTSALAVIMCPDLAASDLPAPAGAR